MWYGCLSSWSCPCLLLEAGPGESVCCSWSPKPSPLHVACLCFLPLPKLPRPGAVSLVAGHLVVVLYVVPGCLVGTGVLGACLLPVSSLLLCPALSMSPWWPAPVSALPRLRKADVLQALAPIAGLKGQITDIQHPSGRRGGQAGSGQVDACILTGAEANSVLSHYTS